MKANRLKRADRRINIPNKFQVITLFMFIFAISIVAYIYSRPMISILPVKHIAFIGNRHLTDDELIALARVHVGESLITISNRKVSQRLLKSPWIRSVSVRKEFPARLSVVIEESVPFALLDMNGHLFLVDEKGEFLEELKDDSIPFLPVIAGDPFKEREGFSEAIKLAKLMNDRGFLSETDHIEIMIRKPHELALTIDGTVVKMGAGRYEEKLERLINLEDEIKSRGIFVDYIDLRFANKAIVKPMTNKAAK
jgi:cell division protein FtsQ